MIRKTESWVIPNLFFGYDDIHIAQKRGLKFSFYNTVRNRDVRVRSYQRILLKLPKKFYAPGEISEMVAQVANR
jgi:hypothetical protein